MNYNACWYYSALRIAKIYSKYHNIPKECKNKTILKYINEDIILDDLKEYDKETKEQADLTIFNEGNAIEFLTTNGIYYNECIPIRNCNGNALTLTLKDDNKIIGFLLQFIGHYSCIIYENNEFIFYDQVNKYCNPVKLPLHDNKLTIPINSLYTNIYIYAKD